MFLSGLATFGTFLTVSVLANATKKKLRYLHLGILAFGACFSALTHVLAPAAWPVGFVSWRWEIAHLAVVIY